jgi:hypothetical protein
MTAGGYLLAMREWNEPPQAAISVGNLAGRRVQCRLVTGHGKDFAGAVDEEGMMRFRLPGALSFGLYEYETLHRLR